MPQNAAGRITEPAVWLPKASGTAANLFSSYVATASPLTTSTGTRWFFTNSAGTIYTAQSDVFAGITAGKTPPGVGGLLQ